MQGVKFATEEERRVARQQAQARYREKTREARRAADLAAYYADHENNKRKKRERARADYPRWKESRRAWRKENKDALKLCRVLGIKIEEARRLLEKRTSEL